MSSTKSSNYGYNVASNVLLYEEKPIFGNTYDDFDAVSAIHNNQSTLTMAATQKHDTRVALYNHQEIMLFLTWYKIHSMYLVSGTSYFNKKRFSRPNSWIPCKYWLMSYSYIESNLSISRDSKKKFICNSLVGCMEYYKRKIIKLQDIKQIKIESFLHIKWILFWWKHLHENFKSSKVYVIFKFVC